MSGAASGKTRRGAGAGAPFYPFLFSLYPVLFLYARNIREVPWTQALLAAAVSLGMAIVLWPCTRLFSSQAQKRGLLLFLFLLLFHTYGLYYGLVADWLPRGLPLPAAHALAFVVPGGACALLMLAALRARVDLAALHCLMTAVVLCLIVWNLAGILVHHGRSLCWQAGRHARQKSPAAEVRNGGPDIYCLILDEFAAPESVRSLFGYDNSAFCNRLRQMGFFVARDSRSPFLETERALASLLNPNGDNGRGDPFQRIRANGVAAFLKERGYRIIEFPVARSMFMEAADQRHYYSLERISIFFNDFFRMLFERSLLRILPEVWSREGPDASRYYRERVLQVFEKLPEVMKITAPKFVFVHLYCPHEPFIFNARGGPASADHFWDHADPNAYLQQYIFISAKILETASAILAGSPRPPVIIIQSDHGYRGSRGRKKWQRRVEPAESTRVFNALYLPGVSAAAIAPSLSPLNNFRLVFNLYFATAYPLAANP
jgi:hypothetical protein